MLHFFNPGHEEAIANASKYYQPSRQVAKLQNDLALLPSWYANPGEEVLVKSEKLRVKSEGRGEITDNSEVDFWGISPAAISFVEKLNREKNLSLHVPQWKAEYRELSNRQTARNVLELLIKACPEIDPTIVPVFYSNIEDIETAITHNQKSTIKNQKFLIKSPFSSSGRGLVWLPEGKIARSERQIIGGMLKRQGCVSLETALDRQLDFSMHFEIIDKDRVNFIGYSVFLVNTKGAYEKSLIASQAQMKDMICRFIDNSLLERIRNLLHNIITEIYSPHYKGNIGIDMFIYHDGVAKRLHPCVEINMRKSMGYLAIRLAELHLHPESHGELVIDFYKSPADLLENHRKMQDRFPLIFKDGLISKGYFSLCPIEDGVNYRACVFVKR